MPAAPTLQVSATSGRIVGLNRGHIVRASFPDGVGREQKDNPDEGPRPWIILTANALLNNSSFELVHGVPLTTTVSTADYRFTIDPGIITAFDLPPGSKAAKMNAQVAQTVLGDQVRAFSPKRIILPVVGSVPPAVLTNIEARVKYVLSMK